MLFRRGGVLNIFKTRFAGIMRTGAPGLSVIVRRAAAERRRRRRSRPPVLTLPKAPRRSRPRPQQAARERGGLLEPLFELRGRSFGPRDRVGAVVRYPSRRVALGRRRVELVENFTLDGGGPRSRPRRRRVRELGEARGELLGRDDAVAVPIEFPKRVLDEKLAVFLDNVGVGAPRLDVGQRGRRLLGGLGERGQFARARISAGRAGRRPAPLVALLRR